MMIATRNDRGGGHPNDADLLDAIMETFSAVDPMPPDLPDRIRFALALRELEAEVVRIADVADEVAPAARGAEESRMVTFDSNSLTIMIRVESNQDGTARVDGWLAPPKAHRVEMRLEESSIIVMADDLGRFVFYCVPRGTARLIVRPPEVCVNGERSDDPFSEARSVITPALTLLSGE
jgi:hypothetical protein